MATFDPNRRCRLHEQLNGRIDDWMPITVEEWRQRMKWHDAGETVMDWDGLLYDGWEPIYRAAHRGAVVSQAGRP